MGRRVPWHIALFALFPALFLYAHNADRYTPVVLLLPLAAALLLAGALWGIFRLLAREGSRAAVATTLALILFFSYGHLATSLGGLRIALGPILIGPHRALSLILGTLFLALAIPLLRGRTRLRATTTLLNTMGLVLIALSLGSAVLAALGASREEHSASTAAAPWWTPPVARATAPDIYYVILDGYARADILAAFYDFDNRPLVAELERRGFYVAAQSHSNYVKTSLSLASSLNLTHLQELAGRLGREASDQKPLAGMIRDSEALRFLRHQGYTTVAFATGYTTTALRGVDHYLAPGFSPDEFQNTLLNTTPVPALLRLTGAALQHRWHRERIRFAFERLADLRATTPGLPADAPLFVFAHLVVPHPPFVFGPTGEPRDPPHSYSMRDGDDLIRADGVDRADYVAAYRDQVAYVNQRLRTWLEALRAAPPPARPRIIVFQGDHGPGSQMAWEDLDACRLEERFGILNAYYVSGGTPEALYPTITPVNTFRVLFNHCFATELPLLPDASFFSTASHPYAFTDVTDRLSAAE